MSIYFCLHLSKCLEKQFKCIISCLYFHHAFHLAGKQNCFLCTLTKSESLSKACQPTNEKSKPNSSCRSCSWKQIHKWEIDIEPPPLVPTMQRWQSPPPASPASPVFWAWQWLWLAAGSQHRALDPDTGPWKKAVEFLKALQVDTQAPSPTSPTTHVLSQTPPLTHSRVPQQLPWSSGCCTSISILRCLYCNSSLG